MAKVTVWSLLSVTIAIAFLFSTQLFTSFEAETVGPAISVIRSRINLSDETLLIEFRNIGSSPDSVSRIVLPGTGIIPVDANMIPANSDSTILIVDLSATNPGIMLGQIVTFQIRMESGMTIPLVTQAA